MPAPFSIQKLTWRNNEMKTFPLPVALVRPGKDGAPDVELKEVTMMEPKGSALRGLETIAILRMDYTAHRIIIPRLCPQLTANDLDAMCPRNLLAVQQEVVGFFVE
ncbi:hypothetical protein [Aeromonas phage 14AhydR10PP]|nr:hypothetical protein [Aeromonas phage 14AhydR10PP]